MILDRNNESDSDKCKEISYIYKRYNNLISNLIHAEKEGKIDTEKVKASLLDIQNAIHDDILAIVTMEGLSA